MTFNKRAQVIDHNIELMAAVDTAVGGGWSPLWTWSANVRGFVSFLNSIASGLTGHTHEVLFADGVVMPAVPRDNHRGLLIGWGVDPTGATLSTSCLRLDKPVAYRIRWSNLEGR